MADTSRIHSLVERARRRLKIQSALDGAVLAVIPAAAAAAGVVFLVRSETIGEDVGIVTLLACTGIILVGAVMGWLRRFSTSMVATRLDRASGLSDRLATACAFEEDLRRGFEGDEETRALMEAAVADAVRAAPRANVKAATPFRWPSDTRGALAFTAAAAIIAGLYLEPIERFPVVSAIEPPAAPRGAEIEIRGARFGSAGQVSLTRAEPAEGAPVFEIVDWTPRSIHARVPASATVGRTVLVIEADGRRSQPVPFEVLPDGVHHRDKDEPIALAEDDIDYTRDLLDELRETAEANQDQELRDLTSEIEKLLDQAEKGELSRETLLEKLAAAQEKYMKGADEKMMEESLADLEKSGKELQKSELTKEMGKALAEGDLEKAKKEMQQLAEKLAKGEIGEKQAQEASKALEKAAKEFEKKQAEREKSAGEKVEKAQKELEKAEKQVAQAKTPEQKAKAEKQRDEKQKNVEKQQQERQKQQASEEKRTLKRLHRNMEKTAQEMGDKNQEKRKQASRSMEDMARDTGKVDSDKRKMTNQKKVASQLGDLKEAMRRAKKGGSRGPQDSFGRNKKQNDFNKRARGGRGSRQAWKPGQQGPGGQNGQKPGGTGKQPGGSSYGDGSDPDLLGDPTKKNGNTKDEAVSGIQGKGPSTRETILSAAQKGFASQSYKQVYGRYKAIVEEIINAEKIPPGYNYYVKKYFQKIKPHEM